MVWYDFLNMLTEISYPLLKLKSHNIAMDAHLPLMEGVLEQLLTTIYIHV